MNVAGATVRSDNVRLLATMLDGDAEEIAAKLVEVLRERGALSG